MTLTAERRALLHALAGRWGTPLYVYDFEVVRERVALLAGFDVVRYAQKANSNLSLLRRMRALGVRLDAVSAGEIQRALLAGFEPEEVQFTADVLDLATLDLLARVPVPVNLGSADMIEQVADVSHVRDVTLRVNPGFGHGHDIKVSTGGRASKHGIWATDLQGAVERCAAAGLRVTGLHMHIGSGSDFEHLSKIRESIVRAAEVVGGDLRTISTGGGLPVPYRPEETAFDVDAYLRDWEETRAEIVARRGAAIELEVEPGRFLVAESGVLLTEVRACKRNDDLEYVLVDAGFDSLIRPAMYGAYHHVSKLTPEEQAPVRPTIVAGPLCESADMFTQTKGGLIDPRPLAPCAVGDLLCVHGAGAYASSMASNYNSRLFAAEVLLEGDEAVLIRERQTFEQLVANELAAEQG